MIQMVYLNETEYGVQHGIVLIFLIHDQLMNMVYVMVVIILIIDLMVKYVSNIKIVRFTLTTFHTHDTHIIEKDPYKQSSNNYCTSNMTSICQLLYSITDRQ